MRDAEKSWAPVVAALAIACGGGSPPPASAPTGEAPTPVPGRALVISSPGAQVEETYDYGDAGDLVSIRDAGPGAPLTVSGFDPKAGRAGTIVSVTGTGFHAVPAANVVRLNGSPVSVIAATSTRLSFAVPADATTGRVSVAVGGATTTSVDDFTIDAQTAISDFTPKIGKAGTVVTITGSGFDPDPARNTVSVGTASATVQSATATTLVVSVGAGGTGKVSVSTGGSSAMSSADFIQLPGTMTAQDVGFVGRIDAGASTTIALPTAGKKGLVSFDGTQGEFVSIYVTGVTFAYSSTVKVYDPQGTCMFSNGVMQGTAATLPLPALPSAGTYTLSFEPSLTSTGTATVRIYRDVVLAIDPRGAPVTMTLPRGQNGRLVFTGRPGDQFDLATTTVTTPANGNVPLGLVQPDGTSIGSKNASGTSQWQLPRIAMPGSHTVTVRPAPTNDVTLTFVLSLPLAGKLVLGGAPTRFQTSRTGQTGRYAFDAVAGQSDTLKITSTLTSTATVGVYRPSGSAVGTTSVAAGGGAKIDLGALPESGTYAVTVVPAGQATGFVDLALLAQDVGTLSFGDAPKAIPLLAGQSGRYTFAGEAGSYVSFGLMAISATPSGGYTAFGLLRPDGVLMASTSASTPTSWQPGVLPSTGTYTFTLSPPGVAAGSTTVLLSRPITGRLTAGGSPVRFESNRAGQTARFTFDGAMGESYTLKAVSGTGFSGYVQATVYRPNGSWVASTSIAPAGDAKIDLSLLPETGTYTFALVPPGAGTGVIDVSLLAQDAGTLAIDGPAKAVSLVSGQNGRYTFTASANDLLRLSYPAPATMPAGKSVQLSVYKPDRSLLGSKSVNGPGPWDLPQIPATGNYTLVAEPQGTAAAALSVALSRR